MSAAPTALAAPIRSPKASPWAAPPSVVLFGSLRRDLPQLQEDAELLKEIGCQILSPKDLSFVDEKDGFVRAAHEVDRSPADIEESHLAAIVGADFVWLHCPEGYVGISASLELGYAKSLGIPAFARCRPKEVPLDGFVIECAGPLDAVHRYVAGIQEPALSPLRTMQAYYRRAAVERGYDSESAQETLLLLTEEIGELARAIRKRSGGAPHASVDEHDAAHELADVQLYVLHLANVLGLDLAAAVRSKERINKTRLENVVPSTA